ncbi:MAG TPA: DUF1428 family protein [Lentibacillus sp.]|uniref:DUF1428 family protein n=1 Tax=Lentibacillus sp. TaxID=1925746 RepID=UPI002B4B2761|nr:DUF1428 family protein [Lentibacillus sp.]HLR61451.1 DUF1428 family protein [Lentibacillus sp.]
MYTVIYLYRVNRKHAQEFIDIKKQAGEICLSHGALEDNTYLPENLHGNYGCKGLVDVIQKEENEEIFLGQSVFRNKSHHDDVIKQVDENPEFNKLFNEITSMINLSKVISATFSTDN